MEDQLQVVWNKSPRVLSREQGMLGLVTFKYHLTLDMKSVIHAVSCALAVTPGGMTSQLHVLVYNSFNDHLKQLYSKWLLAHDHVITRS
jgi:hypothetical protein